MLTLDERAAQDINTLNVFFLPEHIQTQSSLGHTSDRNSPSREIDVGEFKAFVDSFFHPSDSLGFVRPGGRSPLTGDELFQVLLRLSKGEADEEEILRAQMAGIVGTSPVSTYAHEGSQSDAESFLRVRRLSSTQFSIGGPSLARFCSEQHIGLLQFGLPNRLSARRLCAFFGHGDPNNVPSLPEPILSQNVNGKTFHYYTNPFTGRAEIAGRMADENGHLACLVYSVPLDLKIRFKLTLSFMRSSTNERMTFDIFFDYTDPVRNWAQCSAGNMMYTASDADANAISDQSLDNRLGTNDGTRGGGSGASMTGTTASTGNSRN
ncbi:MAG: hypothetical protein AB7P04_01070 [Bacteriovoracia bacterium]